MSPTSAPSLSEKDRGGSFYEGYREMNAAEMSLTEAIALVKELDEIRASLPQGLYIYIKSCQLGFDYRNGERCLTIQPPNDYVEGRLMERSEWIAQVVRMGVIIYGRMSLKGQGFFVNIEE
jgi:hypothetical protein